MGGKAPVYEEHNMESQCEGQDSELRYSQGVRVTAKWSPAGTWIWGLELRKRLDWKYWPRAMATQRVMGSPRMSEITRDRMGQGPG